MEVMNGSVRVTANVFPAIKDAMEKKTVKHLRQKIQMSMTVNLKVSLVMILCTIRNRNR